jgi:helix-turn-helix protein
MYASTAPKLPPHRLTSETTMNDSNQPLTLTVPEAGRRYFGLSRQSSYGAAQRGDLPTIRIGRLLRVPVRALERMLDCAGSKGADHG